MVCATGNTSYSFVWGAVDNLRMPPGGMGGFHDSIALGGDVRCCDLVLAVGRG